MGIEVLSGGSQKNLTTSSAQRERERGGEIVKSQNFATFGGLVFGRGLSACFSGVALKLLIPRSKSKNAGHCGQRNI